MTLYFETCRIKFESTRKVLEYSKPSEEKQSLRTVIRCIPADPGVQNKYMESKEVDHQHLISREV